MQDSTAYSVTSARVSAEYQFFSFVEWQIEVAEQGLTRKYFRKWGCVEPYFQHFEHISVIFSSRQRAFQDRFLCYSGSLGKGVATP